MGDEGIGVHIIRELKKISLPDNVELLDIGVSAFSLVSYIPGRKKIIIVDAVKSGGEAGSIYKLSLDDIEKEKDKLFSLHQIGIAEILTFFQFGAASGEVVIIGVEIGEIKWGMELSPCIKEKIPHIIKYIVSQIS